MWDNYKKYLKFDNFFTQHSKLFKTLNLFLKKIIRFLIVTIWSLVILKTYFFFFQTFYVLKFELFFNIPEIVQLLLFLILTVYFRYTLSLLINNPANFMMFGTLKFFYIILFLKNFEIKIFLKKTYFLVWRKINLFFKNYWIFRQLLNKSNIRKTKKMKFLKKILIIIKKNSNNKLVKLLFDFIKTFFVLLDVFYLYFMFFFKINKVFVWKPHNIRLPYFKKILKQIKIKSRKKNPLRKKKSKNPFIL